MISHSKRRIDSDKNWKLWDCPVHVFTKYRWSEEVSFSFCFVLMYTYSKGFPGGSDGKEARDPSLIPGL